MHRAPPRVAERKKLRQGIGRLLGKVRLLTLEDQAGTLEALAAGLRSRAGRERTAKEKALLQRGTGTNGTSR